MNHNFPQKQFPITTRVLTHLNRQGWTPERKKMVIRVFGLIIRWETGVDPDELLTLAQIIDLNGNLELDTGKNRPNAETVTVADLVENLKDLAKSQGEESA